MELGANLAEVARRKLAEYPEVEIITSSFEDWDPSGELFDAVVSFNAFHWIDPDVRFSKPAAALRPGGSLGVYGSLFFRHDEADPVWLAAHEDDEAVFGDAQPVRHVRDARDRSDEFTRDGHFATVTRKTYFRDLTYSAGEYVELLGTMSSYRALEDSVRDELFERMRRRIEEGGGSVNLTRGDVLYVATTV